jgi:hypothetical protein
LGHVPEALDDVIFSTALLQVARDGTCRFGVPDVANYLIDAPGRSVTIAPARGPHTPAVGVFLLGTIFGILCHKRGLLPLHASCVSIGGGAVAFAGRSGVGKSTLAAEFFSRGNTVLADDVTVVDPDGPGGLVVWPAFPRLRLWHDAVTHFELPLEGLERDRQELTRYLVRMDRVFGTEPRPLAAVYLLRHTAHARHESIFRLRGLQAVKELNAVVYRGRVGRALGENKRQMIAVNRLCAEVPMYLLTHRPVLSALEALVGTLAVRHEQLTAEYPA